MGTFRMIFFEHLTDFEWFWLDVPYWIRNFKKTPRPLHHWVWKTDLKPGGCPNGRFTWLKQPVTSSLKPCLFQLVSTFCFSEFVSTMFFFFRIAVSNWIAFPDFFTVSHAWLGTQTWFTGPEGNRDKDKMHHCILYFIMSSYILYGEHIYNWTFYKQTH